jgi:peptidoglycan/LPS O-acetylase OafA/YrhL
VPEQTSAAGLTAPAVQAERFVFLDGLRGWGAVVVVIFHYLVQIFPPSPETASILKRIIFLHGTMAVWVFFVVSGFSLSIGYIKRKDRRALTRLAIGRYPRLVIPVFVACTLVHLMMVTGLIYPVGERPDVLKPFLNFETSFSYLFRFSFVNAFFDHHFLESYIPPLWTMSVELIGSAVVIALLAIFGRVEWRLWIYTAVMITLMLLGSLYGLFVAGILLAEIFTMGAPNARWFHVLLILAFVGGLLVPACLTIEPPNALGLFGIAAWCGAWMFLPPLRRLLQLPISRWLGRLSFPLYLVHAPLAYSLCVFLLRQIQGLGFTRAATNLIVVALSIPAAIAVAWLFTPVNESAVRISRWIGRTMVEGFESFVRRQKTEPVTPVV